MQQLYEYTVIPAPARGEKARGARTPAERFSFALLTEMNRMAANGWEYVRAETLPLVFPALGTDGLQRGERVRVRLGTIDELTLEVNGTVVERLGSV